MTGRVAATSAAILFALAGGVGLTAQDPCLRYEPAISELTGTIKRVVFPGPPNYESVTRGDKPETCWVLYLPKKVCVDAGPEAKSDGNDAEANVTSLQLMITSYDQWRAFLGKQATVRGTLVHATTGHHHTDVLLEVAEITAPRK